MKKLSGLMVLVCLIAVGAIAYSAYQNLVIMPKQKVRYAALLQQQAVTQREQQQVAQSNCLATADKTTVESFSVICLSDARINGGTSAGKEQCSNTDTNTVIEFMTASAYRNTLFQGILQKRDADRAECLQRYPSPTN